MSAYNEKILSAFIKALGMCVSTGIASYLMWKFLEHSDPHKESKKKAKRKLEDLLNLDPKIELNSHEMRLANQIVLPNEGVEIEEVGGCYELLRQLENNIIAPLLIRSSNIHIPSAYYSPPKGILLHGPPGCGKTLIARALAKKAKATFINFDISVLNDMWYGETSKLTKALFTLSNKIQPCIIFIDEIDSILRNRSRFDHEATAVMKTQFMALWDGFAQTDSAVTIIGATNRPEDVDAAILRRLPFKLHVPKPDLISREEIIQVLLRKENKAGDFDFKKVATNTEGMSGSDLKEAIRLAINSKYCEALQDHENLSLDELQMRMQHVQLSSDDLIKAANIFMKNMNLEKPFPLD